MKLISKTLLYYLLISLPLLLIAGIFSYYLINSELKDGTDESLSGEQQRAEQLIRSFSEPQKLFLTVDSTSIIQPVQQQQLSSGFSDTLIYDKVEKEPVNFRILRSYYTFRKQLYQITLLKNTVEEDELLEGILSSFAFILVFLLMGFFLMNWLISKKLWFPFHKTLSILNTYQLKNHKQYQFDQVNTIEFNQLNKALNNMTTKIYSDYQQQKEFTENAAHELQTPLAVIKASTELLMQSPNLEESEMNRLQVIDNTIKKMVSLNKALLLLSKIESNQFTESETIHLNQLIIKSSKGFEDFIAAKKIQLNLKLDSDIVVTMNAALADILISNLLQNAIRHNQVGGQLTIELKEKSLLICNSGEALHISPDDLFVRFKKNEASADSHGLGLAIVKSIVDLYGFSISYNYRNGMHQFSVGLK